MYINRSLREYLNDLAAKKPAPGGGSASALAAAIGAGLMSMVANYTVGNPKYKAEEKKAADILARAGEAKAELERLVDADVEAYGKLSKAMKEFEKNSSELDAAYKEAARVPFEICRIVASLLGICKDLAGAGNKNLVTDTAIAAILLEGAFFSAKYNVYINLKYIKDMEYIGSVHNVLAPLEESMPKLKEEILEMCEDVIK
ncbi:MAG: cyclodeaminase/cyclohydrolase family protein [Candidatus Omnitrophica bacterium]|nr:cyclodeaminase/cyclohydrolase family protein [Candidatus Omnitrophota bacterium]